jgi:protein gp37
MTRFKNYDLPGMPAVLKWNPVVMRCPGCGLDADPTYTPGKAKKHCWHLRACDMGAGNGKLKPWMREIKAGRKPAHVHTRELCSVMERKKPAVICAQFMGDVGWYTEFLWNEVLWAMGEAPQHVFVMLTKWPERVRVKLPDNCWIGTSVSDQATADERIPKLLQVQARHKWVSVEPMLGPVDLHPAWIGLGAIEFVACGPETGGGARGFEPLWLLDLDMQCGDARVPFYDKRDVNSVGGPTLREWPEEWKAERREP